MSRPDATAIAAIDQSHVRPVHLAWLDFASEQVRSNSSGANITLSGMPDADANGTFVGISPDFADVSAISVREGGTEAVTVTLSGIPGLDDEMLEELSEPANWRGRECRLWRYFQNGAGGREGGVQSLYTGLMTNLEVGGSPEQQAVTITVESYIAALSEASNRTYMDQYLFDPGDKSADAAPGIANGTSENGATPNAISQAARWLGRSTELSR